MKRSGRRLRPLVMALALAVGGCATTQLEGDRLYLAGDFTRAETAYRGYLSSGRAGGEARSRARYRLGLIYALPDSELYDWELASRTFGELIESEPGSAWARQAALIVGLHGEHERLAAELETRDSRVSALLAEVVQLRKAAESAGVEAEDQRSRVDQLTGEIAELRRDIGSLRESLDAREKELARIKRIDLQTPP